MGVGGGGKKGGGNGCAGWRGWRGRSSTTSDLRAGGAGEGCRVLGLKKSNKTQIVKSFDLSAGRGDKKRDVGGGGQV